MLAAGYNGAYADSAIIDDISLITHHACLQNLQNAWPHRVVYGSTSSSKLHEFNIQNQNNPRVIGISYHIGHCRFFCISTIVSFTI